MPTHSPSSCRAVDLDTVQPPEFGARGGGSYTRCRPTHGTVNGLLWRGDLVVLDQAELAAALPNTAVPSLRPGGLPSRRRVGNRRRGDDPVV